MKKKNNINSPKKYKQFFVSINLEKKKLINSLKKLKSKNKKVIGYGASTKGNVILQFCNINSDLLKQICDVNIEKDGTFTPGTNIPIIEEKKAKKENPDYFFVLPWHFKKFILKKEKKNIKKGIRFIFPLPKFHIV